MDNQYQQLKAEYEMFYKYKQLIDKELNSKGIYSIDLQLLNNSVREVINQLIDNSETFKTLCEFNPDLKDIFINYLERVKKIYKKSTFVSEDKMEQLINKSKLPSRDANHNGIIYPKENISFYDKEDRKKQLEDICNRIQQCVALYHVAYKDKQIELELSNGDYIYLEFLYRNLPHILGITLGQVLENEETKRILNIDSKFYEKSEMSKPEKLLELILKDLTTNKDLLSESMSKKQFDGDIKSELLPWDKIDLKTRTFLNDDLYDNTSVISSLAPGETLTSKNDVSDMAKISSTTISPDSKYKYTFTGYGVTDKRNQRQRVPNSLVSGKAGTYKYKFANQKPHSIVSVTPPNSDHPTIFTPEQQLQLYVDIVTDFGGEGGMDLSQWRDEIIEVCKSYQDRIIQASLNENSRKR